MTDNYLIAQTLGFATGSVLYGLLLVLVWKAERLDRKTHTGSLLVLLTLVWNFGSLMRYGALLMGYGSVARLADALAYSVLAMLPTLGLMALPWPRNRHWQRYVRLGLLYLSFAIATSLTVGLFGARLSSNFLFRYGAIKPFVAYNFILHLLVVLIPFSGAGKVIGSILAFKRALLLIMSTAAIGVLLSFLSILGPTAIGVLETFTQQITIPMAIVTFAFISQFHFADVFVKRSLTILGTVFVVVIYLVLVVGPLAPIIRDAGPRAEAATWTVMAILWCVLLLLFPAFERAINRAADRWIFRRPNYQQLALEFSRKIERIDEQHLFDLVVQEIRNALKADSVRVVARADLPAIHEFEPVLGEVSRLRVGHPARYCLGNPEVDVLLPIEVNSEFIYLIAISSGSRGRKLLSDEMTFLGTLSERIGRKLEAFQLERERHLQQLREVRVKQTTEQLMAGGFAHEMRNALAGSKLILDQALALDVPEPRVSLNLGNCQNLKAIYLGLKDELPEARTLTLLAQMRTIFANEERIEEVMQLVRKATSRGLNITQQIMDYSKMGQQQPGQQRVDLNNLIVSMVDESREEFSGQGVVVEYQSKPELPSLIGDETHYYSIIKNIVLNARDALIDPGVKDRKDRCVAITTALEASTCSVVITDNGIGIPPENLQKLFEPFFSTKPAMGTGLGLGMARKMVSLYNGSIDVNSEAGNGTRVTITLPVTQPRATV